MQPGADAEHAQPEHVRVPGPGTERWSETDAGPASAPATETPPHPGGRLQGHCLLEPHIVIFNDSRVIHSLYSNVTITLLQCFAVK